MGQELILDLLESSPDKWFCAADILERIVIGRPSLYNSLRKLRWHNLVKFKLVRTNDFSGRKHVVCFYKANVKWKED
jgi:hypothetical protein